MMVTWVRGSFKDVHGTLAFDPEGPAENMRVEAKIRADQCWTGEPARDKHLKSEDFLSCERFPEIRFVSSGVSRTGANDFEVQGGLTIRGVTRPVRLDARCHGTWQTPWWEDGVDKGPKTRAGFTARTAIDRYDFGVNWNGPLDRGGLVVSRRVEIVLEVEAIREG